MFEQLCAELPWSQRLGEVWRMKDHEERDMSLALRAATANRLRTAVAWYPRQRPAAHRGSDRDGRRRAGRLPSMTAPLPRRAVDL